MSGFVGFGGLIVFCGLLGKENNRCPIPCGALMERMIWVIFIFGVSMGPFFTRSFGSLENMHRLEPTQNIRLRPDILHDFLHFSFDRIINHRKPHAFPSFKH